MKEKEEDIDVVDWMIGQESVKSKLQLYLNKKIPKGIFGYSAHYVLLHPFNFIYHRIEDAFYATKHGFQRMFRGWDDTMVWSIDYYLADLIPKLVRRLMETKHGTPFEMFSENCKKDENGDPTDEEYEKAREKWNKVLEEIAEGFEEYKNNQDITDNSNIELKKFDKAFMLLKKHFGSLWD